MSVPFLSVSLSVRSLNFPLKASSFFNGVLLTIEQGSLLDKTEDEKSCWITGRVAADILFFTCVHTVTGHFLPT